MRLTDRNVVWGWTVDPRNHVGPIRRIGVEITHGKGYFSGLSGPLKSIVKHRILQVYVNG